MRSHNLQILDVVYNIICTFTSYSFFLCKPEYDPSTGSNSVVLNKMLYNKSCA